MFILDFGSNQLKVQLFLYIYLVVMASNSYSQASPDDGGDAVTIETIVVQGEKAPRVLGQMTSLVGVVDQDVLESPKVEHANQLFESTPGIWVSRGNGQEQLTAIRSPVFTGAGACGAFAMLEDGIAVRANGFCNVNQLFETHIEAAESVEVLKGPYSSLVGGNAQFGAISIQLPRAESIQNRLSISGTDMGYRRVGLGLRGQAQQQNFGVLATVTESDGIQHSSGFKQQKLSLRHSWAGIDWLDIESGLSVFNLEQETAGYIQGYNRYRNSAASKSNDNPEAYRDASSLHMYSKLTYRKLDREWTVSPYLRRGEMDFLMHFVPWKPTEYSEQDSVGWQLQWRRYLPRGSEIFVSQEAERTWASLVERQDSAAPFAQLNYPVGVHYDYSVRADTAALAAGALFNLSRSAALDIGARLEYVNFDYTNGVSAGWGCDEAATACRFYRPNSHNDEYLEHAVHAGVAYQFDNQRFWFAKLATGYRLPQATELYRAQSQGQSTLDAEELVSFEAGLRMQIDNWFSQLALFSMHNRNGIIQDTERRFINGVDTRHQGLEYEVRFDDSVWQAKFSGQIADHEYRNNPKLLGVDVNLQGRQMDTAPAHTHSVSLARTLASVHKISWQSRWLGEYYLDPQNQFTYEGHFLTDVAWRWEAGEHLSTELTLLNLWDRKYAERADVGFGEYRYFPGLRRRLSLSLKYTW